ncbi:hypothetical protein EDD15DRAFT_2373619 [Pisolithus albus]|nr:hypothetical protein EDD15DRAFT_2373619 [Pisolithus albus]
MNIHIILELPYASTSPLTPSTQYLDCHSLIPLANWDSSSTRQDLSKGVFLIAFASAHLEILPIPWRKAWQDGIWNISGLGVPFSVIPRSPNSPCTSLSPPEVSWNSIEQFLTNTTSSSHHLCHLGPNSPSSPLNRSPFSDVNLLDATYQTIYKTLHALSWFRTCLGFVFGQGGEVRFMYLTQFHVEPLAFLHGDSTHYWLPGDAFVMVSCSSIVEIWAFSVYHGFLALPTFLGRLYSLAKFTSLLFQEL